MRICTDSCVFINGLTQTDLAATRLLEMIGPDLILVIPRLVAQEVTRNLQTPEQVRRFYRLFHQRPFAFVIDELVPPILVMTTLVEGCRRRLTPSSAHLLSGWGWITSSLTIVTSCEICRQRLIE